MNRRNILLIEGFFCIMILFIIVTQVTADSAPRPDEFYGHFIGQYRELFVATFYH